MPIDDIRDSAPETADVTPEPRLKESPIVVGIGASAGGLEALERFFRAMPADSGLAFVVIQHLAPDFKSLMSELLAKHTRMGVKRVENGMPVEANTIYLIPPKYNMIIFHGQLVLMEQDKDRQHGLNLPIDLFLRSLAEDCGNRAVGVILSGTGSDGIRGLRAIKEAGGMVIAQKESTAKFDGMPRSAIATGLVDFVLAPEEIPAQLLRYVRHPHVAVDHEDDADLVVSEDNLLNIAAILRKHTGLDLTFYKPTTVVRRIERRMNLAQIGDLRDYVMYLGENRREIHALYKDMLIAVTSFFRDREAFALLRDQVVPELFQREAAQRRLRVWVAGCATGEEVYSLAMLLHDEARRIGQDWDIKLFGTDIDRDSIEFASAGVYPDSIVSDLDPELLGRFFTRKDKTTFQVVRGIREMVIFAQHNLVRDPPFTRIDLLSCRNLLIYLQPLVQKKLLAMFNFALKPGAVLFLGPSESTGELTEYFEPINAKWKIFRSSTQRSAALADSLSVVSLRDRLRATSRTFGEVGSHLAAEQVLQAVCDRALPPAVVVDASHNIVHVVGDVSPFIGFAAGQTSLKLYKAARAGLAVPLETALNRASKERTEVVYRQGPQTRGDGDSVLLRVCPLATVRGFNEDLFAVFFEAKQQENVQSAVAELDAGVVSETRVIDLERELQYSRENLQATIEELETSNEELQATNEELVASNEELQSTNEELQSVNEELYTVNTEYQDKIQELTRLNNDMDTLLAITDIGILLMSADLTIRRFSPAARSFVNVLPADEGRPLSHLSHNLLNADLVRDAESVLRTGVPLKRELRTRGGGWVTMLVSRYEVEAPVEPQGVLISFVDITELREIQAGLASEHAYVENLLSTVPSAVMVVDVRGHITLVNEYASELLGLPAAEITARRHDDVHWRTTDFAGQTISAADFPFARVLATRRPVRDVHVAIERPDQRRIYLSVNATPLLDPHGEVRNVVMVLHDVSALLMADRRSALQAGLLASLPQPAFCVDADGTVTAWNEPLARLSGRRENDVRGHRLTNFVVGVLLANAPDQALDDVWSGRVQLLRKDGAHHAARVQLSALRDSEGRFCGRLGLFLE